MPDPRDSPYEAMVLRISRLERELIALRTSKERITVLNQTTLAQITGDTNDYDVGYYDEVRISSDNNRNITGISGGVAGRLLLLRNIGTFNITLVHASVLSLAQNRIFIGGSTNLVMAPLSTGTNTYALLSYGTAWNVVFST